MSSPTQYDASMCKIRMRLYALSAPSDKLHPELNLSMTAKSAALLARQTNDSQAVVVPRRLAGPQEDTGEAEPLKHHEPDAIPTRFPPRLKKGLSQLSMEDRTRTQTRPLVDLSENTIEPTEQVFP